MGGETGRVLLYVLVFYLFSFSVVAIPDGWGEEINLTNFTFTRMVPRMDFDSNNNLHMVWEGINEANYAKTDENGTLLINETIISPVGDLSLNPDVTVDNDDNVHIVWQDNSISGIYQIFYEKLDNSGNTLINNQQITDFADHSIQPRILTDSENNLHIIYTTDISGDNTFRYEKLFTNGTIILNKTGKCISSGTMEFDIDSNDNIHIAAATNTAGTVCLGGSFAIPMRYEVRDNSGEVISPMTLLGCYRERQACAFRINGVPTGWIKISKNKGFFSFLRRDSFDITESGYELSIESIQFDYCDQRRFCDMYYEAYDLVKMNLRRN